MQDPTTMWRVELIHPLIIHFPIALLLIGSIFWIFGLFLKDRYPFLSPSGRLLLLIGTIGAWIAVYTGGLADGQVARSLCDPTVAKEHERFAWFAGYLFSAFVILEWGRYRKLHSLLNSNFFKTILAIILIGGCTLLGYVGHLGGTLVYQQSAAVYQPTEGCKEFN